MLSSRPLQLNTDGAYFPLKTPGRGLKNRAENAHAGLGGLATGNGKGKNAGVFPKTPFQNSAAKPQTGKQRLLLTTTRPLGDKTPMPNRFGNALFQTPLPGVSKMSKLVPNREGGTPDSVQRPSSMRKHIKQPRNSKGFETPVNNGNHWDISDGDIVIPEAQPETILEDEGDDLDEVEYGPPNTLDLPYELPFDFALPDYREVGKTLFQLAYSTPREEIPVPDFAVAELESAKWDMMSLPPLESDDPFYLARLESTQLVPAKGTVNAARMKPAVRDPVPAKPLRRDPLPAATKVNPRLAAPRSGPRIPSSDSAASVASVRSNPIPTSRTGVKPSATTAKVLASAKPKAPAASAVRNVPSRSGASSVAAHAGAKPMINKVPSGKPPISRRPHTSTAVMNPKTQPKATNGGDLIAFNDTAIELDDENDFRFEV